MKRWFQIDLWKRVLAALLLGLGAGLALRYGMGPESSGDFAKTWIGWLGELFLRMIKMLIIPLVFFTLVSGVVAMGDPKKLGSLGGRALAMYFGTTAIAVTLGLLMG
ncbi:MAG: cation:dicarboxylase symporter family transporter, partial [Planctomycetota bacterium]